MASISKLSIRGIRSFSHERDQVIEFYAPLTMIVGANGCGKTTIIECLKYACTGTLPPGARNGQSFVHDPKASTRSLERFPPRLTTEVKANIKLRFAGRDGRMSVVIRSFQLTQKKVTLQFKALDGVIRTKDDKGASVSITHKCTELDKHIPLRLGVSKAILENVVFCHQEDASWPLQEGAVVKKKFDDIFESARYTKALDTIKKTKQEYAAVVKDLKIDLAGLQERLRAAETLRDELEESQENYDKIRKEIERIDARTSELTETLTGLQATAEKIDLLQAQKQSLQLTCRDAEVRMAEKRETIGSDLSPDSDEVLQRNLSEFDNMIKQIADEVEFYKEEASKCVMRAQAGKKNKDALQGEQGSLQAQLSHQERLMAERDGLMERLSERYDIFNPGSSALSSAVSEPSGSMRRYTPKDIASFEETLKGALEKANADLHEARTRTRLEEDRMNADMSAVKVEQRSSSDAVRSKEIELNKVQREHSSLSQASSFGGGSSSQSQRGTLVTVSKLERQLKDAERGKEKADKELSDFQLNDKRPELTRDVKGLETRMSEVRDFIAEEESLAKALSEDQEEQSKISVKSNQIVDDMDLLREAVNERSVFRDLLDYPLEEVTVESLGTALTDLKLKKAELDESFADKTRAVIDLGREVAAEEANHRIKATELRDVRQQIENSSSVLDVIRAEMAGVRAQARQELDPEKDFDLILKLWVNQESKMKKKNDLGDSIKKFHGMMLKKGEEDHVCPSCKRAMDEKTMETFRHEQQSHMDDKKYAERAAAVKENHQKAQASVEKLQSCAQRWRDWARLSARAPRVDEAVAKHQQALSEKNHELEKAKKEQNETRESRDRLHEAVAEASKFADEAYRIHQVEEEVKYLKSKQARFGNKGTLSDAQERLRKLNGDRDRIGSEIEEKRKELQHLSNRQWQLTSNSSMLESDLTKARSALDAKKEFERRREVLKERGRTLEAELKELKAKEQPLRQQLMEKTNQYSRMKDQLRASVDRLQSAQQECQADVKAFTRSQADVTRGVAKKLPEVLASIQARLQEVTVTIEENEESAKENEITMNTKTFVSDKQMQRKKILRDNIEYRAHARELKERQKEVAAVEEEIIKTDSNDVRERIDELNRESSQKAHKRAELRGRLLGMKDQIRGVENKLATDTYRNVEEKHRRKMIEHRTTEMAVSDLDKYWTALDKALLRFHTMKIADINKIIRELWAMTYSGEDIDMIEIVSGDDDEGGGKAKRSYNYRVVMRKNDATLDMKGRCSAGQRVLASVVIRLALAEAFCVSCGILALDEPTTNLDHHNKVGLAHALAKIISNRARQSNFQLVTITHDEDFVQTMRTELGTQGGFSMPEFYWRISREEMKRGKFYSRIDRLDWEDM
ncbi:unnamed protein product [Ascophyllum nodosum]